MLDITTLAAWGEFIGGIAVVVSLIYLAGQIRQNSKLVRTSTASATAQLQLMSTGMMAQDPEVARIYWDGLSDRDSLSETDRRQFDPLLQLQIFSHLQQWEFNRDGVGSSAVWGLEQGGTLWLFQQGGARHWWREWGGQYPQGFRNYVDGLIREGEAAE